MLDVAIGSTPGTEVQVGQVQLHGVSVGIGDIVAGPVSEIPVLLKLRVSKKSMMDQATQTEG